jgi:hypothetical protein
VHEYCTRWSLSELHWYDLMNDASLRDRVDLEGIVRLASAVASLMRSADVVLLMQSANKRNLSDVRELVDRARDVSGLKTGDVVDDAALFQLLLQIHCILRWVGGPRHAALIAVDQRGGAWTAGTAHAAPFPGVVGDVIHVAGVDWPEVQIADFASFAYQRQARNFADGKVSGPYRDLVEVFAQLNEMRLSPSLTRARGDLVEGAGAALGVRQVGAISWDGDAYQRFLERMIAESYDELAAELGTEI